MLSFAEFQAETCHKMRLKPDALPEGTYFVDYPQKEIDGRLYAKEYALEETLPEQKPRALVCYMPSRGENPWQVEISGSALAAYGATLAQAIKERDRVLLIKKEAKRETQARLKNSFEETVSAHLQSAPPRTAQDDLKRSAASLRRLYLHWDAQSDTATAQAFADAIAALERGQEANNGNIGGFN